MRSSTAGRSSVSDDRPRIGLLPCRQGRLRPYHRGVPDSIAELRNVVAGSSPAPIEMAAYLEKVRDRAYAVVDRDIEELKEAGFSEDAIFEQTVAVAIAEGLRRLDLANEAIG